MVGGEDGLLGKPHRAASKLLLTATGSSSFVSKLPSKIAHGSCGASDAIFIYLNFVSTDCPDDFVLNLESFG